MRAAHKYVNTSQTNRGLEIEGTGKINGNDVNTQKQNRVTGKKRRESTKNKIRELTMHK